MVAMIHWPLYRGGIEDDQSSVEKTLFVLNKLGNPHSVLKNIIHLTGTNGKGSTSTYIANILKYNGYNVNLYTSPHIYECNERVKINGTNVSDGNLYYAIEKVRLACAEDNISLTAFEANTIAAFIIYAETKADVNVIEVGMGGRDDATNVFDKTQLKTAIFTPIDCDHVRTLGKTPYENAIIKSYIIKPGCFIISAKQAPEVSNLLQKIASGLLCPLFCEGTDYIIENITDNDLTLTFKTPGSLGSSIIISKPSLQGCHQFSNAVNAIAALSYSGFNLEIPRINQAIKESYIPMRMEKIEKPSIIDILPPGSELYMDGAHNAHGAKAVAEFIKQRKHLSGLNAYVINGRTKGSDLKSFLLELKEAVKMVIGVQVKMEPLAEPAENIVSTCQELNIKVLKANNIVDALEKIKFENNKQPFIAIICGSLYLARDVKLIL